MANKQNKQELTTLQELDPNMLTSEQPPVAEASAEQAPAQAESVESAPVETAPVEPADETKAEPAPAFEAKAEPVPVEPAVEPKAEPAPAAPAVKPHEEFLAELEARVENLEEAYRGHASKLAELDAYIHRQNALVRGWHKCADPVSAKASAIKADIAAWWQARKDAKELRRLQREAQQADEALRRRREAAAQKAAIEELKAEIKAANEDDGTQPPQVEEAVPATVPVQA